jgi:hypothetical protein
MTSNRIVYTKPFREKVQGQLKARFRLDSDGKPMYEPDDEEEDLRHYTMDVSLETPRASEIKGVSYYMNDPSYVDPEGYSEDADNDFQEEIQSYGDVEILVTVEMTDQKSDHEYEQRAWLSNMLENGHADDMTPAIRAAIRRIKAN